MDFECHLIRFRHALVVNKQVVPPLSGQKVELSWTGGSLEIKSHIDVPPTSQLCNQSFERGPDHLSKYTVSVSHTPTETDQRRLLQRSFVLLQTKTIYKLSQKTIKRT